MTTNTATAEYTPPVIDVDPETKLYPKLDWFCARARECPTADDVYDLAIRVEVLLDTLKEDETPENETNLYLLECARQQLMEFAGVRAEPELAV